MRQVVVIFVLHTFFKASRLDDFRRKKFTCYEVGYPQESDMKGSIVISFFQEKKCRKGKGVLDLWLVKY